jgi:hypothetical protein
MGSTLLGKIPDTPNMLKINTIGTFITSIGESQLTSLFPWSDSEFNFNFVSFADRDMAMRYYWGLGVGHTYAHGERDPAPDNGGASEHNDPDEEDEGVPGEAEGQEYQASNSTAVWESGDPTAAAELDPGSRPPSVASDCDDASSGTDTDGGEVFSDKEEPESEEEM